MTREEQIYKRAEGDCIAMLESIERGDIIKGSICPQSYRSGFMDGAEWADQHPNWIAVEERLPENNMQILAYNGKFNEVHLVDYRNGIFEDYYGAFSKGVITHWMPLPEAQRKEE